MANEHTFNAINPIVTVHIRSPIEEADSAGEVLAFYKPLSKRDPKPAGDAEMFSIPQGSIVGRYAVCDIFPVDLPEHTHMVRVETRGHTNQGLLVFLVFAVLTLVL